MSVIFSRAGPAHLSVKFYSPIYFPSPLFGEFQNRSSSVETTEFFWIRESSVWKESATLSYVESSDCYLKESKEMGKQPVRMKAVVYALSPFQQKVMPGLWKDFTTKIHHKVTENWLSATLLLTPVIGTYT